MCVNFLALVSWCDGCLGPRVTNGLQLPLGRALERDGDGDHRPSRAQSSNLALEMAAWLLRWQLGSLDGSLAL